MVFGLVYKCSNPYCKAPFDTAKAAKSHTRQMPLCKAWEEQATRAVRARFRGTSFVPGTVNDDQAPEWGPGEDDDPPAPTVPSLNAPTDDPAADDPPMADTDSTDFPGAEFMKEVLEVLEDPDGLFEVTDTAAGAAGANPAPKKVRLSAAMAGVKARIFERQDPTRKPVCEEHPTAGTVIRMADHLHKQWANLFGTSTPGLDSEMDGTGKPNLNNVNIYHPFATKLDWEIARWMVKDGIGHSSFNRLLDIEGVSTVFTLIVKSQT